MIASATGRPDTAAEGSWARFEALYRDSRRDLYAYVCSLLGDPAAAEDVTALAGLSARERELVALKFGAGLSGGEIARVLGMSETGVSTFLYRTMGKLREACDAR